MGPGSPPAGPYVRLVHEWLVYRRDVTRTPIRTLAAEIGISKSAVDHFYHRRSPAKNWPRLRYWYMAQRTRRAEEYQTPPENHLLSALHTFSTFPRERRPEAMRVIAENYRALNASMGLPVPEWVELLAEMADRESSAGPADEPDLPIPALPKREN